MGLGIEIRDVHILGGVVLCGGLGTDIGDFNMGGGGGQRSEFWDRYVTTYTMYFLRLNMVSVRLISCPGNMMRGLIS